jgi:hypothetical protein
MLKCQRCDKHINILHQLYSIHSHWGVSAKVQEETIPAIRRAHRTVPGALPQERQVVAEDLRGAAARGVFRKPWVRATRYTLAEKKSLR